MWRCWRKQEIFGWGGEGGGAGRSKTSRGDALVWSKGTEAEYEDKESRKKVEQGGMCHDPCKEQER